MNIDSIIADIRTGELGWAGRERLVMLCEHIEVQQNELATLRAENTRYASEIAKDRAVMMQQEADNTSLADRLSGAELERDRLGAERDTLRAQYEGTGQRRA